MTSALNEPLAHASLFSGFGGFDRAAELMGWRNLFHCEWNPFAQRILEYYWPNAHKYNDITKSDFTIFRDRIDVLSGGFPCQPFSLAGKRKGKEDDRYLFAEVERALDEIRPRVAVLENVAGLISILEPASFPEVEREVLQFYDREHLLFQIEPKKRAKIEIQLQAIQRRVLSEVIEKIEAKGYFLPRTEQGVPVVLCLPACAVNAPHRRDRIWLVAYRHGNGCNGGNSKYEVNTSEGGINALSHSPESSFNGTDSNSLSFRLEHAKKTGDLREGKEETRSKGEQSSISLEANGGDRITSNSNGERLRREIDGQGKSRFIGEASPDEFWQNFPTQSPLCSGDDGLPSELDGITFSNWRKESIRAAGNAIVPQVAFHVFSAIEKTLLEKI